MNAINHNNLPGFCRTCVRILPPLLLSTRRDFLCLLHHGAQPRRALHTTEARIQSLFQFLVRGISRACRFRIYFPRKARPAPHAHRLSACLPPSSNHQLWSSCSSSEIFIFLIELTTYHQSSRNSFQEKSSKSFVLAMFATVKHTTI